jgi:hypothetical protein
MKKLVSTLFLLIVFTFPAQAVVSVCDSGPITVGSGSTPHSGEFVGVVYDQENQTSTWFYRFTSGRRPAISHITFEMLCPSIQIIDAGMWSGTYPNANLLPKAGKPEPRNFPANPAGDPTTGIKGLKFDLGFDESQSRNYYFTVNGL